MNIQLPDHHAEPLLEFLGGLRPGDLRDIAANVHDERAMINAVEALREAIEAAKD